MQNFNEIKKHLARKRNVKVEITEDKPEMLQFTVTGDRYEKLLTVFYRDGNSEDDESFQALIEPRPMWHHYYVFLSQEMVPFCDRWGNQEFGTVEGGQWCLDEEDALDEIKRLCRNWRK